MLVGSMINFMTFDGYGAKKKGGGPKAPSGKFELNNFPNFPDLEQSSNEGSLDLTGANHGNIDNSEVYTYM